MEQMLVIAVLKSLDSIIVMTICKSLANLQKCKSYCHYNVAAVAAAETNILEFPVRSFYWFYWNQQDDTGQPVNSKKGAHWGLKVFSIGTIKVGCRSRFYFFNFKIKFVDFALNINIFDIFLYYFIYVKYELLYLDMECIQSNSAKSFFVNRN